MKKENRTDVFVRHYGETHKQKNIFPVKSPPRYLVLISQQSIKAPFLNITFLHMHGTSYSTKLLMNKDTSEGWDMDESRQTTDPDKPTRLEDSVTGRHEALESPQVPITPTSLSPDPYPSPPTGTTNKLNRGSSKHRFSSTPPEGTPAPPEDGNVSSECLQHERKNGNQLKSQKNKDVWNFITIRNNCIDCIKINNKNILDLVTNNLSKTFTNHEHLADKFLKILRNFTPGVEIESKCCQQALGFIIRTDNTIKIIGPFKPTKKKHSEDFIIDIIEEEKDLAEVWLYSTNNPCLGRKSKLPCMYNLISIADKYKFKLYIGFSEYYFFIKNMDKFIENLEKDKAISWNPNIRFSVKLDISKYVINNISLDKRFIENNLHLSRYSHSKKTYKGWQQLGLDISEKLESKLREKNRKKYKYKYKASSYLYKNISDYVTHFKYWWTRTVDENFNRHAVPAPLQHIETLCPNVKFFHH